MSGTVLAISNFVSGIPNSGSIVAVPTQTLTSKSTSIFTRNFGYIFISFAVAL